MLPSTYSKRLMITLKQGNYPESENTNTTRRNCGTSVLIFGEFIPKLEN